MANIPLQSISFPGLSDKYTTPVVDNTLAVAGAAADAKKTGDEIGALKNDLTQGTFPVGNAENADQLTSTVGVEDKTPYLFRTSGGSVDIGDRETVNKIVGGTIVNNQLFDPSTVLNVAGLTITTVQTGTYRFNGTVASTSSGNIGATYLANHVYYLRSGRTVADIVLSNNNTWQSSKTDYIIKPNAEWRANLLVNAGTYENADFTPQIVDLTQDFGTTIADYVYSLETATAGAGVAWLKKHFPKQFDSGYQAYDAGSLQSVSGLTEHKLVGINQFDKAMATNNAYIRATTGEMVTDYNEFFCSDYIHILPDTVYYSNADTNGRMASHVFFDADLNAIGWNAVSNNTFTAPQNACYMRVNCIKEKVTADELCINLHWDGEKDGTYEPYKEYIYALDSSLTLRGNPKVDASGNLYYDGDEYLPDGTVNRRYGIVDLGTLAWGKSGTALFYTTSLQSVIKKGSDTGGYDHIKCVKYVAQNVASSASLNDKCMSVDTSGNIQLIDNSFETETSGDFRTAMSGIYLLYEKATPDTETAEPYQETQIVDDFGTEEFVLADGAFPVPVGHNTMYQNNLRAKLEMSPDSPDGDGLYVVQQESGENTYVPLASTATIQDILIRLTALENA